MKVETGINGFGRFGLHLLKYWLDRNEECAFEIKYINDDTLPFEKVLNIINNDNFVKFNKYKIQGTGDLITILEPNGNRHEIQYSNSKATEIPWLGRPKIFLECSGKNTESEKCRPFLGGNTNLVAISATSWDAEKTLVYGFNHEEYSKDMEIISYGSCTVNAYVPLARWMLNTYGIVDSDVNVIHNIQEYRLEQNNTLIRKFCTLEKSATHLLDEITPENFIVNYTVIPYPGVSMIDFRFNLKTDVDRDEFIKVFQHEISEESLKGLYGMDAVDVGPEVYNCTTYSSVFIRDGIKMLGNNLYMQAYFDNENSVNRYYDLVNFISTKQ